MVERGKRGARERVMVVVGRQGTFKSRRARACVYTSFPELYTLRPLPRPPPRSLQHWIAIQPPDAPKHDMAKKSHSQRECAFFPLIFPSTLGRVAMMLSPPRRARSSDSRNCSSPAPGPFLLPSRVSTALSLSPSPPPSGLSPAHDTHSPPPCLCCFVRCVRLPDPPYALQIPRRSKFLQCRFLMPIL